MKKDVISKYFALLSEFEKNIKKIMDECEGCDFTLLFIANNLSLFQKDFGNSCQELLDVTDKHLYSKLFK